MARIIRGDSNAGSLGRPRIPPFLSRGLTGRPWVRLAISRAVQLLSVVIGVLLLTFLLIHLVPGDPVTSILGVHATPGSVTALRKELHLDKPFLDQLWLFISSLAHLNLGTSFIEVGQPVTSIIFPAMRITLLLTATAVAFSLLIGLPLGIWAALSRRRGVDVAIRSFATTLLATPPFLVGFFLLLVIALDAKLAPIGGWGTAPLSDATHVWLPGLALSTYLTPIVCVPYVRVRWIRSTRRSSKPL